MADRTVFINYRGEDTHAYGALLYNELTRQFGAERVFLDCQSIPAGADFVDELLEQARSASVLLAVIGPTWLTATDSAGRRRIDDPDDWIRRELRAAFAADATVIPILTEQTAIPAAADLPADIARLSRCQYRRLRHHDTIPDLARIVADLDLVDPTLATPDVECPYPGLAAFGPEQAQWFFGRDRLVAQIVEQADQTLRTGRPLMVVAPSGAGKSSLLRAGVLPRITKGALPATGSPEWPQLWLTPTAHPLDVLAEKLAAVLDTDAPSVRTMLDTEPDTVITELRAAEHRLIVVVDQFEELFTLCSDRAEQLRFVDFVGRLATPGPDEQPPVGLVLCGLRSDFYTPCASFPVMREALQHNQVFVGSMSSEELREAIVSPAEAVGLRFDPGLVELLLLDLTPMPTSAAYEPGRLPLLAYALRATWQHRRGSTMTVDGYRSGGGIQQAIATAADRVHDGLDPAERAAVRPVFLRLVRVGDTDDGFDDTRRRVSPSELARATTQAAAEAVVRAFARDRLLTLEQNTVVIAHEALLRAWPRLRAWIDTDRAGNRLRQQIEATAVEWETSHHDNGLLWRGSRLADAIAGAGDHPDQLTSAGQEFLAASRRAQRRSRRRRRNAVIVLIGLTVVASVVAWFAFVQRSTAQAETQVAVDREVAAEADALRTTNTSAAARLDVLAYRGMPTDDLRTHLITDASTPLSTILNGHRGVVNSVAFGPTATIMASAGEDHTVRLWNVANSAAPKELGQPLSNGTHVVNSLAFSPAGATLATADDDGVIQLWNIANPTDPTLASELQADQGNSVTSVAFSPDGKTLADAVDNGTVRLWNVADPTAPSELGHPLSSSADVVNSVAFNPAGTTVATAGDDGVIQLWNISNPAHPKLARDIQTGPTDSVNSVAFSPDGRTLASGGQDSKIRLWNVADPVRATQLGPPLTGHTDSVNSVAFSPDGKTLATGGEDGTVRLWNVTDPVLTSQLGPALTGHTDSVNSVAFSPDGRTLASGSDDHTIRLWSIGRSYLTGATDDVNSVAFSHDGRTLASGSDDGMVRLWDVAALTGHSTINVASSVNSVAFSPDGKLLASGSDDGAVRLWNVTDPAHPMLLWQSAAASGHSVWSVVFSPIGTMLAGAGDNGTILLWNVADPTHPVLVKQLTAGADSVNAVAFSPDGRTLASGSDDDTVRLWDVADPAHAGPLGQPLTGHTDGVEAVAFSRNGRTLASGSDDGTVRLWNVANPSHTGPLGQPLIGHTDGVESVAFSSDGRTLASGSDDGTVRLWNIADPSHAGSLGQPLTGHTNSVESVAFSPDGELLASGSDDHSIRLWRTDINQDVQRICTSTSDLTDAQRHAYIPDVTNPPRC